MGIKITAYHYNTLCDTYGCAGMARVSLAMDDTPGSLKHNICNDCLEGIVAAAPLHMVLAREDVKAHIQAPPSPDTFTASSLDDDSVHVKTDKFTPFTPLIVKLAEAKEAKGEKFIIPPDYNMMNAEDQHIIASKEMVKTYNWLDLKKLARDLKIENCNTMKRDVLEAEILKRL